MTPTSNGSRYVVNILVTGADGFVGSRLVPRLAGEGHRIRALVRTGAKRRPVGVEVAELELRDQASVSAGVAGGWDAVVHLAAVASGVEARRDPGHAWEINAAGSARLCEAVAEGRLEGKDPLLLLISTAEVYGAGRAQPRRETDLPVPCSPYAASKLAAEVAAFEVARRRGLRVVVARPFPHTGAGQDDRFVVPAFARRLRDASRAGAREVPVGNLTPVRDILHVEDVVDAYVLLLSRGRPGTVYNVASGEGISIEMVFRKLADLMSVAVKPRPDPALVREADIPHLVGDAGRLRQETGWVPRRTLDEALGEVVRAEAH